MSFFPDIVDGQLLPEKRTELYTPREKVRRPNFEADGAKRDKPMRHDAPVMADIHECEPNRDMHCVYCNRIMPI